MNATEGGWFRPLTWVGRERVDDRAGAHVHCLRHYPVRHASEQSGWAMRVLGSAVAAFRARRRDAAAVLRRYHDGLRHRIAPCLLVTRGLRAAHQAAAK